MRSFLIFLGIVIGVGGCSAQEGLNITAQSEQMIVIWYNPDEASGDVAPNPDLVVYSADQIREMARDHCGKNDMEAVPVGIKDDQGGRETTFLCMEPANCQWCNIETSAD